MQDQPANKSPLQLRLEKFVAEVNPAHLVIGTAAEYEDEVRMFLERVDTSMDKKQLVEVLHEIFHEMFATPKHRAKLEAHEKIVQEYLKLRDS
jgi:hypothetical protein